MIGSHGYETRVRNSGSHHLQTNSNLHRSLAAAMLALFLSAIDSTAGETRIPGSSFPPDTSPHCRPAIPQDLTVARQQPHAVPQLSGVPIEAVIQGIVDVNNEGIPDDGRDPSIALNPENPNLIVIHGGFGQWGNGSQNASVYVSFDGGTTWNRPSPINPPPGGEDAGCPCDTTIYYGANSQLFGSFLGAIHDNTFIYTAVRITFTRSPPSSGTW